MTDDSRPIRGVGADPYPSGIYSVLSYPAPDAEPVAEPVTEPVTEPAAEPVAEPAARTRPAASPSAQPGPNRPGPKRLGDVEVTATGLRTPAGDVPLPDAVVSVADDTEVRTPAWAVFCTIVGFLALPVVSLLFLLARETVATGAVRVTISGAGVRHTTLVRDPDGIELARSLAAGH